MKNLLIFLFFSVAIGINAQTLTCEQETVVIGPVSCEMENGMEYLSVTLMVSNFSGATCSSQLSLAGLPDDVTLESVNFNTTFDGSINIFTNGSYDLSIPSEDCADVPFNATITPDDICVACETENITLAAPIAPIPTLGQWALIVLSILFAILGINFIRRKVFAEA